MDDVREIRNPKETQMIEANDVNLKEKTEEKRKRSETRFRNWGIPHWGSSLSSTSLDIFSYHTQYDALLIYVSLLVVLLQGLGSDTVQVSLTVLRDSSTTLWRDLKNTNLLQSLDNSSVDGARSVGVLAWSETSVLGTSVQLVQLTDTNLLSQVDVSGSRGGSLVEPGLGFLWRQLVAGRSLHKLNVTWNFQFTLTLQELSVSVDKVLSWNVSGIVSMVN